MPSATAPLILASASPRRRELLQSAGIPTEVHVESIDESIRAGEESAALVRRLARTKSAQIAARFPERFVLAADTIVVVDQVEASGSSLILGKPRDDAEAAQMLQTLSGREHRVLTAFSLQCVNRGVSIIECVETAVAFVVLSADDIHEYIASGEPRDKAGSYAIQGLGARFVKTIRGSYTNVVGLPLAEVCEKLRANGFFKE